MSRESIGVDGALTEAAVRFSDVLKDEMREILNIELPNRDAAIDSVAAEDEEHVATTPPEEIQERRYEKRVLKAVDESGTDLAALCLSGGGIRSATFALGVMQGLARFGLLGRFHYLSSVSGGGYIASWLTAWRSLDIDGRIFKALNRSQRTGEEAPQITGIRADSNYLTPQLGLLSADTWTLAALYVRNLLLNWILFVPFFMGCFLFPRLCASVLDLVARGDHSVGIFEGARAVGVVLVTIGLSFAIYGRFRKQRPWLTQGRFRGLVLLFLVLSGASFTVAAVAAGCSGGDVPERVLSLAGLKKGALVGALAYLIAWVIGRFSSRSLTDREERRIEWIDVVFWSLSGALVGVLAAVGISVIASELPAAPGACVVGSGPSAAAATDLVVSAVHSATAMGLSGFVLAYLLGELVYVGIASFSQKADMDREWLARSSGWLSATAVGWAMYSGIALFAPAVLDGGWIRFVAGIGGLISGGITGTLGWSSLTAATKAAQSLKSVPLMRLASAAAIIFAVLVTSLLSLLDQRLEGLVVGLGYRPLAVDAFLMIALIVFAAVLSLAINVNRFSMHALYRNRLVRAFLGSARVAERKPDPFTGFDPHDNLHLAELAPKAGQGRLFHVINAALNVVSTTNRAWQERKAESFTMTRRFCGNPFVRYQRTASYGGKKKGGLTLGTAMAISGAAVSPNQGYNSSPLIGFLLMLLNVRLGWWLGSPRQSGYKREGPTFSLSPALRELAGDTSDQSKWIYLSDGGHFENLGLYEMVRRRCRKIIVSDAGCDPSFSFEDLGNAVRKIYIDFGVSIEFETLEIKPRQDPPAPGLRFAIGSIHYPGSSRPGWLLYLKPTYQQTTERADVRSYATAHRAFPHESTTDQWFSESQLESYRALGANITEYVCSGGRSVAPGTVPPEMELDSLLLAATQLMQRDLAQPRSCSCSR